MAVTIKDVAKLANVAPSTVSRVIADSPRISEKTKRKVREAMDELKYHPNFNARSLANRSTQAIGIIMPSSTEIVFQNPFFPEVIRGISTVLHKNDYALYMSTGQSENEIFDAVVRMVQGRRVDGIILLYSRIEDRVLMYLQEQNFPFTVIGKPFMDVDQITHVDNDNFRAAKEVTEHLIQLGHDRIAFVGGNLDLVVTVDRLLGYERALRNAGIPHRDDYITHERFLKEGGQEAVNFLMMLETPPTALVVADDLMAFGVISMLNDLGYRVPEDVSVVSFNNLMLSEYSHPPLTSVDINIYQLGVEATHCLLDKIDHPNGPSKRIIVPHQLIIRQSSSKYNNEASIMS